MREQLKYVIGRSPTRPVFVLGTGRSGTHWLGQSLEGHPGVRATIEGRPMFGLSTRIALDPRQETRLYPLLAAAYRVQLLRSAPKLYLDKSHPNIWIAERLQRSFPNALFVAIERNPFATVASMMKHSGVAAWHARWREFPVPNRFLGITTELARTYGDMPLPAQCATRWLAHHDRLEELSTRLGNALMVISYEEFAHDTVRVIGELQRFLGLEAPIPVPHVKLESLDKWRTQLGPDAVAQITAVVGRPPDAE